MIKSILKFSVSNIVNLILGVLSAFVLTRVFAPETYGVLNVFNTSVATGLSILYLGLDSSYIRFYNEPPNNNTSAQLGSKLLLISLFATTLAGLVMSVFFFKGFTEKLFGFSSRFICSLMFASIFAQIVLRYLNIKYRMDFNARAFTIQAIILQLALKLFVVITALAYLSIEYVLFFNVAGVMLLAVCCFIIQRRRFFSCKGLTDLSGYRQVFLFALFSAPLAIGINLNASLSQQIISHNMGMAGVGVYSSANYFVSIFGALQGGFATFWSAYMYANYKEKQEDIKKVNEYMLLVIVMAFGAMILGQDIFYLLIGSKYQASKKFFSLVMCYPMLTLAAETTAYGISIKKKTYLDLICFGSSIALNLILAIVLVPHLGLVGAAAASAVSGVLLYILRTVISQRYYCSISDKRLTAADILAIVVLGIIPAVFDGVLIYVLTALVLAVVLLINRSKIKEIVSLINGIRLKKNAE